MRFTRQFATERTRLTLDLAIVLAREATEESVLDLGWGVLNSAETPGGCWTHFSVIETRLIAHTDGMDVYEYKSSSAGDPVDLEWESPGQDGFAYRSIRVRQRC